MGTFDFSFIYLDLIYILNAKAQLRNARGRVREPKGDWQEPVSLHPLTDGGVGLQKENIEVAIMAQIKQLVKKLIK